MKPVATQQKLRGGYYTPKPIADFLARWAIRDPTAQVLEPSCGDGSILESAAERMLDCGTDRIALAGLLHGVEIDPQEAQKAANRVQLGAGLPYGPHIHVGDFFTYCHEHLTEKVVFDVVLGNPPFIRYQDFAEEQRSIAFRLMHQAGLHPSRLTNTWVPFLVAATMPLNEGGRIGMVLPAELLQVNYAAEVRRFLSEQYTRLTIVTFRDLVFTGIQQEVVLLLGEKEQSGHTGIRTIELNGIESLLDYEHVAFASDDIKEMDHSKEKWIMYFLDKRELGLLRRLRTDLRLTTAGHAVGVDVGIVTGFNDFFVLTEQQVKERGLAQYTQPIVGRSAYLPGLVFSELDWRVSIEKQAAAFLLNPPAMPLNQSSADLQAYVGLGSEQDGDRIELNPRVMIGKPIIRGTRIPVDLIVRLVAQGIPAADILRDYPRLQSGDINAALCYAGQLAN